jgi:hypothetical protein
MTWAPGELERMQAFYEGRAHRIEKRVALEHALSAPSMAPFMASYACFEALLWPNPEPEPDPYLPDSEVVKNQNVW